MSHCLTLGFPVNSHFGSCFRCPLTTRSHCFYAYYAHYKESLSQKRGGKQRCVVWWRVGKEPPLAESKVCVCAEAPPLLLHNRWLSSACACVCPEGPAFVLIEAALRWVRLRRVRVIVRLAGSLWGPSFFVILPVHHQHLICSLLHIFSISRSGWKETGMFSAHTFITRPFISFCVWGYLILTDIDPPFFFLHSSSPSSLLLQLSEG